MLIRTGGGHSGRLSIPRDTLVEISGHGLAKINSAFYYGGPALAIKTVEQFLGIQVNHVVLINFTNFPKLVDAMGGVDYTGSCVVSVISGGFRNGGFTLRLQSGTHHLDGAQALALARTRENHCNPRENDLTRELRQQKLLLDMKSQMLSLSGFIRLPWIAWALPQTIETDMGAPTLAGTLAALELGGNAHNAILEPTGSAVLPDGEQVLTITQAAKQADVAALPGLVAAASGRLADRAAAALGRRRPHWPSRSRPWSRCSVACSPSPSSSRPSSRRRRRRTTTRRTPSRAGASWSRSRCCRSRCP